MVYCINRTETPACFENPAGTFTQLTRHTVQDETAPGSIGYIFTDQDGLEVDVSVGTVTLGACPANSVVTKETILCEALADGTKKRFCRVRTSIVNPSGVVIGTPVVSNYELDLATAYAVVDEANVSDCSDDCTPIANTGVLTSFSDLAAK